jgi:4-hydroxy-tetrahydrodipicolinate reductase
VTQPVRVFQVASGNVGSEMIPRIVCHSELQLVGLHYYSPDKVGRAVVDAPPGIVTRADLPLRAFAGRFLQ